jgi:hypothetical protein
VEVSKIRGIFIMSKFICVFMFFLVLSSFSSHAQKLQSETDKLEDLSIYNPHLDESFLTKTDGLAHWHKTDTSNPKGLTARSYSQKDGLYAGYIAESDIRLLFISTQHHTGPINAKILYLDKSTKEVKPAFTLARYETKDSSTLKILVGGVDLISALRETALNPRTRNTSEKIKMLTEFLSSDVGKALSESIPVLYSELEVLDKHDNTLAGLKAPFGAMRMALDLVTNRFSSFTFSEGILEQEKLKYLIENCEDDACLYRSSQFVIHNHGLFDVLTDFDSMLSCQRKLLALNALESQSASEHITGNSSNQCFGYCGPGCLTPGNVKTSECEGHDQCVCEKSHFECLFSAPSNCGSGSCPDSPVPVGHCSSLISAIISYIGALFGFDWGFGSDIIVELPWENTPCNSFGSCNNCYFQANCYPSHHIDL